MTITEAYFPDKGFKCVDLKPGIKQTISHMNTNEDKLKKLYSDSKNEYPNIIAICDLEEGILVLNSDNEYRYKVWLTNETLVGHWEFY